MIVKLLTEHHLEFLSLKGGCRGSSESTLVKMSNCWKSHAVAHYLTLILLLFFCPKMAICLIYSNAIKTNFIMEANTMNPDQTAPKGAVWSGFIVLVIKVIKVYM